MAKDGDIKSQLGAFVRSALHQLDAVRDVVVQKSKQGRIQLDVAMLRRKRKDVLAEIGEVVVRLAASGKISEESFPELGGPLSALEALDERIADEEERARQVGVAAGSAPHGDDQDDEDDDEDVSGPTDEKAKDGLDTEKGTG